MKKKKRGAGCLHLRPIPPAAPSPRKSFFFFSPLFFFQMGHVSLSFSFFFLFFFLAAASLIYNSSALLFFLFLKSSDVGVASSLALRRPSNSHPYLNTFLEENNSSLSLFDSFFAPRGKYKYILYTVDYRHYIMSTCQVRCSTCLNEREKVLNNTALLHQT